MVVLAIASGYYVLTNWNDEDKRFAAGFVTAIVFLFLAIFIGERPSLKDITSAISKNGTIFDLLHSASKKELERPENLLTVSIHYVDGRVVERIVTRETYKYFKERAKFLVELEKLDLRDNRLPTVHAFELKPLDHRFIDN